uniref:Acyl-ACP thioesterase n=1 Tax=uncultured Alphaproteobacteria bacterium TaxID=91750 RepID=A0A6G8F2S4_9PROT|nr:acyl-ACP thioesterase [uncultured Alphaproteobacteria bacterium]
MQISKIVKDYLIRSYECDRNGTLRIVALMNIFQDVADSHASQLGIGMEHCLKHGLAWIGSNYHIKIERMPAWHEKISVASWPAAEKKIGAVRDFEVRDEKQNVIIRASSQWVLIDFAKKRPVALRDNIPDYQIISERALDTDFPKIDTPERADFVKTFNVRYDDIDVNGHVNNAIYPLWATESTDVDFRLNHSPQEIEISFKKESLYGETIKAVSQISNNMSLHSLTATDDNREVARLRIVWN